MRPIVRGASPEEHIGERIFIWFPESVVGISLPGPP